MRILHILWDGDLGGVQRYVLKVIDNDYWPNATHVILFLQHDGRIINRITLPQITQYHFNKSSGLDIRRYLDLKSIIKHESIQLIHCHCDSPAFTTHIPLLQGTPVIYTEHGDSIMREKNTGLIHHTWRWFGRSLKVSLMNSSFVENDFLKRFPWLSGRTTVLLNPLTTSKIHNMTSKSSQYKVGTFARLVNQKGIDWLIQVAELCISRIPEIEFNIYGDGPLKETLLKLIHKTKLDDHVFLRGYTDTPLETMATMNCNVVPSRTEPFGLVALEAQSVGVPIVGFNKSGVAEIIVQGKTGYIVEHGDLSAMANALCKILLDPRLQQSMSQSAITHARTNFSLQSHVLQLNEVYQRFVAAP
ncbi:MAG: glycosyltransferase family 4 protein [Planctomycetes bacterium]|nr:glycosyltransferase family 4 protein [Planctomycetota bacterium]